MKDRDVPKINVCGHCASAPRHKNPKTAHRHCYSPDGFPCRCAQHNHTVKPDTAATMARTCHLDVDAIYASHGQKRRTVTDEQRVVLAERLAKARAARGRDAQATAC